MVTFPGGERQPALGIGTWRMGESKATRAAEIASIRTAIALGFRIIDTAEMYGDGSAEEVVGAAIAESLRAGDVKREELFVVSKVFPHNASAAALKAACDRSRSRLRLDVIDCYLLHWRGPVRLEETVRGFEALQADGGVRLWGVSNFDLDDMRDLESIEGGGNCAVNQIYLSLTQRDPQYSLMPWLETRGIVTMAYSPLDQGALARNARLRDIAERLQATASQVALAWLVAQPQVMAIVKASNAEHLAENAASSKLILTAEDCAELDRAFAPPTSKRPLAML